MINLYFKNYPLKLKTPSHLNPVSFGWGGKGISVEAVKQQAIVPVSYKDIQFKPFQPDPMYKGFNLENLDLTGLNVPIPSQVLVEKIQTLINRSQPDPLAKAGFAFVKTPFDSGTEESLAYIQARLFGIELLKAMKTSEEKQWKLPSTSRHFLSDSDVSCEPNASTTSKFPHYDVASRLVLQIVGPLKGFLGIDKKDGQIGFTGGNPQVSDFHQYLNDHHMSAPQFYKALGQVKGPLGWESNQGFENKTLQKLLSHYTVNFDLVKDSQGKIIIALYNNDPRNISPDGFGILHGATPISISLQANEQDILDLKQTSRRHFYHNRIPNQDQMVWCKNAQDYFSK